MVKKLIIGCLIGAFLGHGYASHCQGRGRIYAYAVFIGLGVYYAISSHLIEGGLMKLGVMARCLSMPILMPLVLALTIGFITPQDNRVMYRIFEFREPDPIGPGFFTFYIAAFMIVLSFVVEVIRSVVRYRASS